MLKTQDASTLIQTNLYNTDKQNVEERFGDFENQIPDISGLVITGILNTKIAEVENKIPDTSDLVTTVVLNTKIIKVEKLMFVS